MFDELATRIRSLEGDERVQAEQALVDSFNLYFSPFEEGVLKANTLEDVESFFGEETEFKAKINPSTVLFEFARQLAQLREANGISETTFAKFAKSIFDWLNKALKSLRQIALTLDSEEGVFAGTAFQQMVTDMEKEMRRLNDRINGFLAAEEAAPADTYHLDPVVNALIEMGAIMSKSTAQRRWSKEKFAANKSQWEDAPRLRNPRHNTIYNPDSGISPDEAAGYLVSQGLLPPGSSASEMWAAVSKAAESAAREKGHMARPRVEAPEEQGLPVLEIVLR